MMMSEFCVHDSTHYVRVSKVKVIKNMLCFLTQVPSTPGLFWQLFEALRPKDFGLLRWCIPFLSWIHDLKLHSEPFFCYDSWRSQKILVRSANRLETLWKMDLVGHGKGPKGPRKWWASSFAIHWNAQIYMGHIICQVSTCIYADTCIREKHRKTQTNQVFKTRLI